MIGWYVQRAEETAVTLWMALLAVAAVSVVLAVVVVWRR